MSDLDEELARAVAESEADAPAAPVSRQVAPPPGRRREVGLVLGLLVAAGAIATLVLTTVDDAAIYSKGVDELLREREALEGRTVRVQGILVKGSLARRAEPCEHRFQIEKAGGRLDVHYPQCVVPDTFRDVPGMDVDVTATGKLAGAHFLASEIMAKCPSKYDMKQRAAQGEQAPHGPIVPAAPGG